MSRPYNRDTVDTQAEKTLHPGWWGWNGRVARGIWAYAAAAAALWETGLGWGVAFGVAAPIAVCICFFIRNDRLPIPPMWGLRGGVGRLVTWCGTAVLILLWLMWEFESWHSLARWDVALRIGIPAGVVLYYADRSGGKKSLLTNEWWGWNGQFAQIAMAYLMAVTTLMLFVEGLAGLAAAIFFGIPLALVFYLVPYLVEKYNHPIVGTFLMAIFLLLFSISTR